MATADEARAIARSWWIPFAAGVISLVAGILVIAYPDISLLALALISGINLVIIGAVLIGETLGDDDAADRTLRVVVGVLTILAGIIVVRRPEDTLLLVVLALGLWMVLDGIVDLVRAVFGPAGRRVLHLLGGVVHLALGLVILSLPDLSLKTLAVLAGVSFVIRGMLMVAAALQLRSAGQEPAGTATTRPHPVA
jgi:uncharacterized membrane protein HdeD (DUF308 family)